MPDRKKAQQQRRHSSQVRGRWMCALMLLSHSSLCSLQHPKVREQAAVNKSENLSPGSTSGGECILQSMPAMGICNHPLDALMHRCQPNHHYLLFSSVLCIVEEIRIGN